MDGEPILPLYPFAHPLAHLAAYFAQIVFLQMSDQYACDRQLYSGCAYLLIISGPSVIPNISRFHQWNRRDAMN